jgi:hypothetical protein
MVFLGVYHHQYSLALALSGCVFVPQVTLSDVHVALLVLLVSLLMLLFLFVS